MTQDGLCKSFPDYCVYGGFQMIAFQILQMYYLQWRYVINWDAAYTYNQLE